MRSAPAARLAAALACLAPGAAATARADEPAPAPVAAPAAAPSTSEPAAPSTSEQAAPRPGRLVGTVYTRGTSTPVAGAIVEGPGGASATTDGSGRFRLDLPPGPARVAVRAAGFEPLDSDERIAAGEALTVDYGLLPLASAGARNRYRSTIRAEARHEGPRFTVRDEELRQLPGTLGDPFRVIGTLPGVLQPSTLLPYYVVRGASPGMNGFFLDGLRVPQLFHFLVGGGVVHPRFVDHLDFYAGAYDVSFGRYAGGIVDAETRPGGAKGPGVHGETELRLYDASAAVEAVVPKLLGGDLAFAAAGHFGYPGYLISLLQPGVSVTYADYLLRVDWRGLTLEALGSYDNVSVNADLLSGRPATVASVVETLQLAFHRLQLRDLLRRGPVELETAIYGGVDQFDLFGGQGVEKLAVGARAILRASAGPLKLQAGLDGELSRFAARHFGDATATGQSPDMLGELGGERVGAVGALYVNGTLDLGRWLRKPTRLTLGVRLDSYHAGPVTILGLDPRGQLEVKLLDELEVHAGFGLYQQPPAFPVALPGIDTFALQLGLQRAWQGAVGVRARLPASLRFEATGFYEKFANINDVVIDFSPVLCTSPPPESLSGIPALITRQVDGQSYGMELLLRREAGRVTGWISYTLSRSERVYACGLRPSDFDQTHVLNVVVQARLPWRLLAGARFYFATGRPYTQLDSLDPTAPPPRNNHRMPDYVQLDLRVDREFTFRRWSLSAFVEALNLTYSEATFGVQYPTVMGVTDYRNPTITGFNWILPSIGLRGSF